MSNMPYPKSLSASKWVSYLLHQYNERPVTSIPYESLAALFKAALEINKLEFDKGTPAYYTFNLPNENKVSLSTLMDGNFTHRQCEAVEHIVRAGRKKGETYVEALQSAVRSLEVEIRRVMPREPR